MTKEITKSIILQELQDKLGLREFEPAKFLFDETVVPIYDVGAHLKMAERYESTLAVSATGYIIFFRVPKTERWFLQRYNIIFMTGAYTISGLYIGRPDSSNYVYLDLTAAQSASYINDLSKEVTLNPGDGIYVNVDGYTSTGNLMVIIDAIKEEIR